MNTTTIITKEHGFKIKEPGSSITHLVGMVLSIIAAFPLIIKASAMTDHVHVISLSIFILSMIGLYGASTTYHTFDLSPKANKILKKIDHMMIFILIAGSYTPICLIVIGGVKGNLLCGAVWAVAAVGIIIKGCWIYCPKWFSSIIYIAMGWMCLFAFSSIYHSLSTPAFLWLLIGGIIYTIGGVIYSLKLPVFNKLPKNFGSHEIFHLFVLGGSICHFILMYVYVASMSI